MGADPRPSTYFVVHDREAAGPSIFEVIVQRSVISAFSAWTASSLFHT